MKTILIAILLLLPTSQLYANNDLYKVRTSITQVSDSRSTGDFFKGLEIEMKVMGELVENSKAIKLNIISAIDDSGKNLLRDDYKSEYTFFKKHDGSGETIKIKLKNPYRKSTLIKELKGNIIFFIPQNDYSSIVEINNFLEKSGSNIFSKATDNGILKITLLTKDDYEKFKNSQEKEIENETGKIGKCIYEAFKSLFGSFTSVDENSVIMNIQDKMGKIIFIEFLSPEGSIIRHSGKTTINDIHIFDFEEKLDKKSTLRIYSETNDSLCTYPLNVTDIVLP